MSALAQGQFAGGGAVAGEFRVDPGEFRPDPGVLPLPVHHDRLQAVAVIGQPRVVADLSLGQLHLFLDQIPLLGQ
ncbi:hypothetical protein M2437_002459 [Methylorubrum pseudosasae]|nr:hypothetical protein [Methylorubrum pseudosasae]